MIPFREPAWPTSDEKIIAQFDFEVAKKTSYLIHQAVKRYFDGSKYSLKSLHPATENNLGHYLVSFCETDYSAVLHIKPSSTKKDVDCVSKILSSLDDSALNFSKFYISKNGLYEEKVGSYYVTFTEFFRGRHFKPDSSDISALSFGLAQLHDGLKAISDVQYIEQATKSEAYEKSNYLRDSKHLRGQFVPEYFQQIKRYARDAIDLSWNSFGAFSFGGAEF